MSSKLLKLLGALEGVTTPTPGSVVAKRLDAVLSRWQSGELGEIAEVVSGIITSGAISDATLGKVIADWLHGRFGNKVDRITALAADLQNGLDLGNLKDLAVAWVLGNHTSSKIEEFLREVESRKALTASAVRDTLVDWLKKHGEASLADAADGLLASNRSDAKQALVQLFVSHLAGTGRVSLQFPSAAVVRDRLLLAIRELDGVDPRLVEALQGLADGDLKKATAGFLGVLGIGEDLDFLGSLAKNLQQEARDQLTAVLKRAVMGISDAQAKSLAHALFEVAAGKRELLPAQSERDRLGLSEEGYSVWLGIQQVLYSASLAVRGGAIVSTSPMAQPHVFASAAIGFDTKLRSLADASKWGHLVRLVHSFTWAHFANHPGGIYVQGKELLSHQTIKNGQRADSYFMDVYDELTT